jgi:hypothetical protein
MVRAGAMSSPGHTGVSSQAVRSRHLWPFAVSARWVEGSPPPWGLVVVASRSHGAEAEGSVNIMTSFEIKI